MGIHIRKKISNLMRVRKKGSLQRGGRKGGRIRRRRGRRK